MHLLSDQLFSWNQTHLRPLKTKASLLLGSDLEGRSIEAPRTHEMASPHFYGTAPLSRYQIAKAQRMLENSFRVGIWGATDASILRTLLPATDGVGLCCCFCCFLLPQCMFLGADSVDLFHKFKLHFPAFVFLIPLFLIFFWGLYRRFLAFPFLRQDLNGMTSSRLVFTLRTLWRQQLLHLLLPWVLQTNNRQVPGP